MSIALEHEKTVDSDIQRNVMEELRWDTRIDESTIGVAVDNGVVTLLGTVSTYAEKVAAEQAAHQVHGVLDVANDIAVAPRTSLLRTDTEIAQAVRHALAWNVHIPGDQIQSTVTQGVVTLKGSVPYWYQRQAAEQAVQDLFGVFEVVNQINVTPPTVDVGTIRQSIEEALERQAERHVERIAHRIDIGVEDGNVILRGPVRDWAERRAILGVAGHAPGVRSIDDQLYIAPYA